MRLFASIDVGSNTLRLLIAAFANGTLVDVYADRKVTRLGAGVEETGMLRSEAMTSSLLVLSDFASAIRRHGVKHVKTIATSALREAGNADSFISMVRQKTGLDIEVVTGEREAALTLRGILFGLPRGIGDMHAPMTGRPQYADTGLRQPTFFVMDIGGGSSEWIIYQGEERILMGSIPTGVIKLTRRCVTTDPISRDDLLLLGRETENALSPLLQYRQKLMSGRTIFLGTGGTFTSLASVDLALDTYEREKIHMRRIPFSRLAKMHDTFVAVPRAERAKTPGLEPERADLILPGLHFTMKVMKLFHFSELVVSDYGLLEGAILEMKEAIEKNLPEAVES